MNRTDCIACRNIKIIAAYTSSKLGHCNGLFEGLPYPADRYSRPEDFFLNEDEWTTYENFQKILRGARNLVGEKYFYYNCGASGAIFRSWGRIQYFATAFTNPCDGFKRLPFFNRNFTDTKQIDILYPPAYDKNLRKIRAIMKLKFRADIDVHMDYIGDPFTRGLLAAIPTVWGLPPARIKQPLLPYDPVVLFNQEPEFAPLRLDFRMDDGCLTARLPIDGRRVIVGKKVFLLPETANGKRVYLGRYTEDGKSTPNGREALLITATLQASDGRIIVKAGEIYKAPYFILDITYDRFSLKERILKLFPYTRCQRDTGMNLVETISRLRQTIEDRNEAYHALEQTNAQLREAKKKVDDYARNLAQKVDERTSALRLAKEKLIVFNQNLKTTVQRQVRTLKRYDELRRYLSPQLTAKILSSGGAVGGEPQRKMMTVLFSDIRNFSALTDSIEPEEIFHLLDDYLSEMTKLIHRYDGTLNKIIGDGLLVFFGDPIPMEDHARRAVSMAVEMQKKTAELRNKWRAYGHELGIGIGINTGYMTVGNIGSSMHKDYTVIGNQVNIAARLESHAGPGQILVSMRTYSIVKDLVVAKKVGEIRVKGIHQPVVAYDVTDMKDTLLS